MGRISRLTLTRLGFVSLTVATLAACGGGDKPLPGERLAIGPVDSTQVENRSARLSLPAPRSNGEWVTLNGDMDHATGHVALAPAPALRWSAAIGRGIGRDYRITATPVAADGLVFVMDSAATVSAVSASDGTTVWTLDVTPAGEKAADGSGGGLSLANGRLIAGTGFGEILVIDPASGTVQWRRQVSAPIHAAPTSDGRNIYFVSRDDVAYALSLKDGALEWMQRGAASLGGLGGGASVALRSGQVVLPFSSGDLMMVRANSGQPRWDSALDAARPGAAFARIGDVSGDPVIDGNRLYAANMAGQTVQMNLQSGKRNWALPVGAVGPVWPAGGSVFMVSDDARLLRVQAGNGQVIWAQALPQFAKPEKRKGRITYYGPVLAGGRFWVADSAGNLRGFAPEDGALATSLSIPGGAASAPIVMGGVMYVLSRDGKLHAFQ